MDGDDYTYAPVTFDQRVTAALAKLDLEQHKQREEIEHLKLWVHKLLNPNGDGSDTGSVTLLNPQDGI